MKGNLVMTPANADAFERSIEKLYSSIREMRWVAHNMIPESLVRSGLDAALSDLCKEISEAGPFRVVYQSSGLVAGVPSTATAISMYRILRELLRARLALNTVLVRVKKTDHLITVDVSGEEGENSVHLEFAV